MKKLLYGLAVIALGLSACGPVYVVHSTPPPPPPPQAGPPPTDEELSYQSFYDELSPYGQWIEDPHYGYVWLPDVGPDFKPYATNGQWVYTEEGWTWASNYAWGWAAFHYGRWFFADGYGWMWVPGDEWAPAWVSWRDSPEYYGWAPLEPGIGIDVSFGGGYNPPPHYWNFVPHQYIGNPHANNYYINESRNVTIIRNTTIINNTTVINNNGGNNRNMRYGRGPDPRDVGRFSGEPVRPSVIRGVNRPGGAQMNNGELAVYRPRVNPSREPAQQTAGNPNSRPRYAPTRVQTMNNARPVNTNRYGNDNGGNDNRGNNGRGVGNNDNRNDNRGNDSRGNDNRANNGGNDNRGNDNRGNNGNGRPVNNQPVQPNNQPQNPLPVVTQPTQPAQPNNQPNNPAPRTNPFLRPRPGSNQPPANTQPVQPQPTQPAQNSAPAPNNPHPNDRPGNNGNRVMGNPNRSGNPATNPATTTNPPATMSRPFNRPGQAAPAQQAPPTSSQPNNQPRAIPNPGGVSRPTVRTIPPRAEEKKDDKKDDKKKDDDKPRRNP